VRVDRNTKGWIRNRSDELAVEAGCRFAVYRAAWAAWWIERYCRLYEGEQAGERLILCGCKVCDYAKPDDVPEWDEGGQEIYEDRVRRHARCVQLGHEIDWQFDVICRLFGWEVYSERWGRWVRRFRRGSIWVPKKNKKSPTLAAVGLHLTCGDGEMGQKVFFGAKDGAQAREIAGQHAVEMVEQSEELKAECDINRNLMRITHVPTRSFLQPMSSSNERTQKSKEGINGSVLIDETHVVDRAFVRRIKRAGISRSEPLQIEFSTAGTDPDCYGKDQFDHGERVASGDAVDQEFFYAAYAAPQHVTDEEILADPVKFGRMANPAWGNTVGEAEFLSDLRTSRLTESDWADFKTYRLNIWQVSASPWLGASVWAACRRDPFDEANLYGRPCWSGLDLALVRDMTALVHVFAGDEEEEYLLLPKFWLPDATIERYADKAPFRDWRSAGFLLSSGAEVTEVSRIRDAFYEDYERWQPQALAYDPFRAEQLTQEIVEGLHVNGVQVKPGTGIERVAFKQTMVNYAEPTQTFERLCVEGKIGHNGHPILAWQIGHAVKTKPDNSGNYRIVKPEHHGVKTVDGVQAAIMGLALALQDVRREVGIQLI
jgi:phage terminase large subunit-like protein